MGRIMGFKARGILTGAGGLRGRASAVGGALLEFLEKSVDHALQALAVVHGADDPASIHDEDGREAVNVPCARHGTTPSSASAFPDVSPGDPHLVALVLERAEILVGVDPDQGEGFLLEALHERQLPWEHSSARGSPKTPEVEDDDLAAVVRELEARALDVLRLEVRRAVADAESDRDLRFGSDGLRRGCGSNGLRIARGLRRYGCWSRRLLGRGFATAGSTQSQRRDRQRPCRTNARAPLFWVG